MRRWQVANFPASLFPAPMRSLPLKVYTSTVRHGWSSKEATDDSVGAGGSHGHPALRCLPAVSDTGEGAGTDPWGIPVGSALCGRESSGHVLVTAVSRAGHGRVWGALDAAPWGGGAVWGAARWKGTGLVLG